MAYAEGVSWPAAAWNAGTGSPTLNRLHGDSLTPYISSQPAATSYFDALAPWGLMGRVSMRPDGSVASRCKVNQTSLQTSLNWGDNCYSDTNDEANGQQKMVYIPRFCSYVDSGTDINWWVGQPGDTFLLQAGGTHTFNNTTDINPAFIVDSVAKSSGFVSTFEAYYGGGLLNSIAGVPPTVSTTGALFRTYAEAIGAGWEISTIQLMAAIKLLFIIEYASLNSQLSLGSGVTAGGAILNTGYTAGLGGGVNYGNASYGVSGTTIPISYRGIENLWGNVRTIVEGLNIKADYAYWVAPQTNLRTYSFTLFGTPYANSFPSAEPSGSTQITAVDTTTAAISWAFLPTAASGGSVTTYFCDNNTTSIGNKVVQLGGDYGVGTAAGLFHFATSANGSGAAMGARICYLPP